MRQQYINSRLFGELFEKGGQGLVATYVTLLKGRNGYHYYAPIKNKNNKITKGKRLIAKQAHISLTSLEKYLPTLINLGLCYYTKDGGFFMVGSNKINKKYNRRKKVPVTIGKNLKETKGHVNAVLIIANVFRQSKQIDRKITLNKALCQERKGIPLSSKQKHLILKAHKSESTDIGDLKKVENIVLSNKRISNLITGLNRDENKNSDTHGSYWRKKLEKGGYIISRKRYKTVWSEKISYEKYLSMRSYFYDQHKFVTYKNGRVVKPIASEVMLLNTDIVDNNTYNTIYINNIYNKKKVGREDIS